MTARVAWRLLGDQFCWVAFENLSADVGGMGGSLRLAQIHSSITTKHPAVFLSWRVARQSRAWAHAGCTPLAQTSAMR